MVRTAFVKKLRKAPSFSVLRLRWYPMAEGNLQNPRYRTQSEDLGVEAERIILGGLARMSIETKLAMIGEACRAADQLTMTGISLRRPDADAAELRFLFAEAKLGRELATRVCGNLDRPR